MKTHKVYNQIFVLSQMFVILQQKYYLNDGNGSFLARSIDKESVSQSWLVQGFIVFL